MHATLAVNVAAIRRWLHLRDLPSPTETHRLSELMNGVRQALSCANDHRLPATRTVLLSLKEKLFSTSFRVAGKDMYCLTFTMEFHACLRISEYRAKFASTFDVFSTLLLSDCVVKREQLQFTFKKSKTRQRIAESFESLLPKESYESCLLSHSFRKGGTTAAALAGSFDEQIRVLRRRTSDSFRRYERPKDTDITTTPKTLADRC